MKFFNPKIRVNSTTLAIGGAVAAAIIGGFMIFGKKKSSKTVVKNRAEIEAPKLETEPVKVLTLDKINLIAEEFFKTTDGERGAVTLYRKLVKGTTDKYNVRMKFFDEDNKPIIHRFTVFENVKLSMDLIRKFKEGAGWGFIIDAVPNR